MTDIHVDTWLYGDLARFADKNKHSYANLLVKLQEHSTIQDLLTTIDMHTQVRGITFINGVLSAMPGVQPDLHHQLEDGDRVAFFDLKSMWPFQYRHGAAITKELSNAIEASQDSILRHT
jgi:hypothetical protein